MVVVKSKFFVAPVIQALEAMALCLPAGSQPSQYTTEARNDVLTDSVSHQMIAELLENREFLHQAPKWPKISGVGQILSRMGKLQKYGANFSLVGQAEIARDLPGLIAWLKSQLA